MRESVRQRLRKIKTDPELRLPDVRFSQNSERFQRLFMTLPDICMGLFTENG